MNDRFKFRVWDVCKEVYLNPDKIFLDADGVAYYFDSLCERFDLIQYDVVVEQCTGLRDKNGKLIYEGNILRLSFDDGGKVDREIYYAQGCAQYFLRYLDKRLFDCYTFNSSVANDLEIIGNIHEVGE